MRARDDAGQLVPMYAVIMLVAGGAMLLLVHLGTLAVHRARARTAADAAALAGVVEGRVAAARVAAANGATLETYVAIGAEVEVRVRVDSTHATARARSEGGCQSDGRPHPVVFAACRPTSPG